MHAFNHSSSSNRQTSYNRIDPTMFQDSYNNKKNIEN